MGLQHLEEKNFTHKNPTTSPVVQCLCGDLKLNLTCSTSFHSTVQKHRVQCRTLLTPQQGRTTAALCGPLEALPFRTCLLGTSGQQGYEKRCCSCVGLVRGPGSDILKGEGHVPRLEITRRTAEALELPRTAGGKTRTKVAGPSRCSQDYQRPCPDLL